jgi:hypothetical protein
MILKSRELFFVIKKIIEIDILNDIKTEDCMWKSKDNNDKKSDNEKTAKDDILNVKFANMTDRKSFKYANMFINKTVDTLIDRWISSSTLNRSTLSAHTTSSFDSTYHFHLDLMTWWIVSTNDSFTNRWSSHWSHHFTFLSDDISWLCDESSI